MSNATLSASAGSWKKAEAANISPIPSAANYTDVTTGGILSASITAPNSLLWQGVFIPILISSVGAKTITILLRDAADTTTYATSGTINLSSLTSRNANRGWYYIPFSVAYSVTAATSYKIKISCSAISSVFWMRSSTAGDYGYAVIGNGDNSTKIASGDTALIRDGVTLTVDESLTLAPTTTKSLVLGDGATFNVPNPSSPITLTFGDGKIHHLDRAYIKIGTSASRISPNNVTINVSGVVNAALFEVNNLSYNAPEDTSGIEIFGNKPIETSLTIAANASSGQAVVSTVEDVPASWNNGDTVRIVGKDKTTSDAVIYTITKGTKQVTLNTNLDALALAGGKVVNMSYHERTAGVKVMSTNQTLFAATNSAQHAVGHFNIEGIYFSNCGFGGYTTLTVSNSVRNTHDSCLCYISNVSSMLINTTNTSGHEFSNNIIINLSMIYSAAVYGKNISFRNNIFNGVSLATANNTAVSANVAISNFVSCGYYTSSGPWGLYIFGYGISVDGCFIVGQSVGLQGGGITINNLKQQRSAHTSGTIITNAVNVTMNNCAFGVGATNTGYDISPTVDNLATMSTTNCSIGSKGIDPSYITTVDGSLMRFVNYGNVSGDNRSWYSNGRFTSNSGKIEAITDTTTKILENKYNISSDTISGMSVKVSIGCNIANAAYYAGTYTAPTMNVNYDGGTNVSIAASNITSRQVLAASFTPTTSGNPLAVRLDQQTDATGANAKVTWDTLTVTARQYPYSEYTYTKYITATTDDIVANIPTPVSDPLVTITNPTTVAAYTGISFDHGTQAITVNGTGGTPVNTGTMLYDAIQYEFDKSANLSRSKFFYSVDGGLSYNCDYDLSIAGNNVTSTKTLRMGTGKLHISNGYYWTGLVTGEIQINTPGAYNLKLDSNKLTFTTAGTYDRSCNGIVQSDVWACISH